MYNYIITFISLSYLSVNVSARRGYSSTGSSSNDSCNDESVCVSWLKNDPYALKKISDVHDDEYFMGQRCMHGQDEQEGNCHTECNYPAPNDCRCLSPEKVKDEWSSHSLYLLLIAVALLVLMIGSCIAIFKGLGGLDKERWGSFCLPGIFVIGFIVCIALYIKFSDHDENDYWCGCGLCDDEPLF